MSHRRTGVNGSSERRENSVSERKAEQGLASVVRQRGLTRRQVLNGAVATASLGVVGTLLDACGSTQSGGSTLTSSASSPTSPSGSVTTVFQAGGPASLDPARAVGSGDFQFALNVYDTLVSQSPSGTLLPSLATHWTQSADATEWVGYPIGR